MSWLEFGIWFQEYEITPIHRADRIVAVLQQKGPEFHFLSFGEYTFKHQEILDVLHKIIADHGCVITTTPKSDTRQQRFNERIGFRRIGEDDDGIRYQLGKI